MPARPLERLPARLLTKSTAIVVVFLLSLLSARVSLAHPMGNFSVNHYSKITLERDGLRVQYIIDLAEIPAYQEIQQGSLTANAGDPATIRFAATRGVEFARNLHLTFDGKLLPLRLKSSSAIFPPGAGGLPTMKMGFVYETKYPAATNRAPAHLRYVDENYPGHSGWKEIVVRAEKGSTLLNSSVPATDRSAELTDYPTDLLSSPPQSLEASFDTTLPLVTPPVAPAALSGRVPIAATAKGDNPKPTTSPALSPETPPVLQPHQPAVHAEGVLQANRRPTPRNRFTELITAQRLSPWFLFTAALIAIGLGSLHALEPGHGKTIVAAYLVGSRGTARHAVLLGLIVTASHTVGVFALGAVTLYASRYIVPEQLYPWLGVLSGLIIAALGGYMLLSRLTGTAIDHDHTAPGSHGHWFPGRSRLRQQPASVEPSRSVSLPQLFSLGITGGIIPCPAALIVLLSAFALHRIALGFFLIVAFSLGLAAVLIAFGMMMVYARRFVARFNIDGPLTKRWLPVASATFIVILGGVLTFQGLAATNLLTNLNGTAFHNLTPSRLGPLVYVIGLGLILGMRHSTDADHVVAISTIVSKQRSIRSAAFIGSVWGIGHTITIFIVGALIILFGVEIPPRLGLSMEFCVAIMLVVLGILNLTGVLGKLTQRYTPQEAATANVLATEPRRPSFSERVLNRTVLRHGTFQFLRPLIIGLVHGLAGSAAVALLVLSTIHNPLWATFYLLIFGAGTMVGMMCMTAAIAVPFTYAGDRFTKLSRYLNYASGLASLCFGSFLVYQLGYVGNLFGSHPIWTPQ